jgi:hypothetical protein
LLGEGGLKAPQDNFIAAYHGHSIFRFVPSVHSVGAPLHWSRIQKFVDHIALSLQQFSRHVNYVCHRVLSFASQDAEVHRQR